MSVLREQDPKGVKNKMQEREIRASSEQRRSIGVIVAGSWFGGESRNESKEAGWV